MSLTVLKRISALGFVVLLALSSPVAMGGPAKDPVKGSGVSYLVLAPPPQDVIMQFAGTADLVIRGEAVTADLFVEAYSVKVNKAGVQHVVASHQFTFPDGSTLVTADKEVVKPTKTPGVYKLKATMKIVSGTGVYEGATGRLTAHGAVNTNDLPPVVEFALTGAISSPAVE